MGIEIERRFLVKVDRLPEDLHEGHSSMIRQIYFSADPWVRVRIYSGNRERAVLTIKGKGTITRPEVNCEISMEKAKEMWPLGKHQVNKIRRNLGPWELDEFTDGHNGL